LSAVFGTYFINPKDYDQRLKAIELSPRILTVMRSSGFQGGDAKTLYSLWGEALEGKGVTVNVHGPYGRPSQFDVEKWREVVSWLEPVVESAKKAVFTFYDRVVNLEDLEILKQAAAMLEDAGFYVALRPTLWYVPNDVAHRVLSGPGTTLDVAEALNLGINLDPGNLYTRLYVENLKLRRSEAAIIRDVVMFMRKAAALNKALGVPQFGRFTPFVILRPRKGRSNKVFVKKTLPWRERDKSVLSVGLQIASAIYSAHLAGDSALLMYTSLRDPPRTRVEVALGLKSDVIGKGMNELMKVLIPAYA